MTGFIQKINAIFALYFKRSMKSYILTQEEKDSFMNGITREYKKEIKDAFNAGRENNKGEYLYKDLNDYLKNKNASI